MNVTIKLNDQESLNFTDKEVNLITPEEIKPLNISSIFDIIGKINKSKEIKTKNFDHLISAMKVEPLLPVICRQLVAPLYKFTTKYIIKTEQGDKLAKYLDSQEIKYERNKSDFKLQIRAWKPEYNNYCNENNINLNKLEKQTEYNQPFDDYYDELKTKPTLTAALYFTSRLLYSLNDTTPEEQLQYCNFGIINSIYDNTPKGIEKKKDILKK
ncbi:hypothetical protein FACS1894166_12320 [Bacilli bacterium]|nr:hypothetical protein FACS1894166_12320 [Bacilli bacterium]